MRFSNREGLSDFDFTLYRARAMRGTSAMVRVRNEERYLGSALRSILGVFDEIVVIDNASEDRSAEIVREVQAEAGPGVKIRLVSYPHRISRFGPEHGATPEDSVESAVYYTNWSLSNCRYRYVCKWDGDMVLRRAARRPLIDLARRIQRGRGTCWVLLGQTVYETLDGEFVLDPEEVNGEVEVFPYGFATRFVHHPAWERFRRPTLMRKGTLEPVCFLEMKYVGEDEFDHWSTREWLTDRKQREWDNFHHVRAGDIDPKRFVRHPANFLATDGAL